MPRDPLAPPVRGRPVDRLAAVLAALALLGSIGVTAWFFLGFVENDSEFRASSSALLLSLGLGAFAIVPSALVLRFGLQAMATGFRTVHGLGTLLLTLPWVGLSVLLLIHSPLPTPAPAAALVLSGLLSLWASTGLMVARGRGTGEPPET